MIASLLRVSFLIAALAASAAHAVIIDSTKGTFAGEYPFGKPNSATYGQYFHVGDAETVVDSFSLYLIGSAVLDVRGYIGAWNGSTMTELLYSSPTVKAPVGPGPNELHFVTGGLQLAADAYYVAFLSISELPPQLAAEDSLPLALDNIAGQFVFMKNGTNFGQLSGTTWYTWTSYDAWLKVELSEPSPDPEPSPVPEPGSLALLGVALAGMHALRRRTTAGGRPR